MKGSWYCEEKDVTGKRGTYFQRNWVSSTQDLWIIWFNISMINQTMNLVKKNTTNDPQTDSNAVLDYRVCFLNVVKK